MYTVSDISTHYTPSHVEDSVAEGNFFCFIRRRTRVQFPFRTVPLLKVFFQTGICHGTFEIVPQEVLWSIWGSHQTLWSLPLPNVTWHSGTWPYTMTPSIDQTLHLFANLLPNWTLIPILTLLPNFGGFHRTLQRVRLANRGRLLLRTPGPVLFGTCICSNVETILSLICHVYGPFEFRTSLGTSILLSFIFFYSYCLNVLIKCSLHFVFGFFFVNYFFFLYNETKLRE